MVFFPTAEALTPCLMGSCSPQTRETWKERYRYAKKYGIRATVAGVSGTGMVGVLQEAAKDGVKRYIGGILVDTGLTCFSAGLPLLTNPTKVVKYSKACHSVCAASWRAADNIADNFVKLSLSKSLLEYSEVKL